MPDAKAALIIPNYNRTRYLMSRIDGALNQMFAISRYY